MQKRTNEKNWKKISYTLIRNLSEGKISDQDYKDTLKKPEKMHIDKSEKWWQKWRAVIIYWTTEKMLS